MIFLREFILPNEDLDTIGIQKLNVYNSHYPLGIFPKKGLKDIKLEDITIFYGNNGSGKTTLLNLIANKLEARRKNINDLGPIFDQMVEKSEIIMNRRPNEIKLILSDDVFDGLLEDRAYNSNVNRTKEELVEEYWILREKYMGQQLVNDYEMAVKKIDANRYTPSKYVRKRLNDQVIIQQSNGQKALDYWEDEITENAIYLIDEPENSLSAKNQIKLKKFIEDSARFYQCQFIIATHSPFFLSLKEARIYDLDSEDAYQPKKWHQLESVRTYFDFFMEHKDEFE